MELPHLLIKVIKSGVINFFSIYSPPSWKEEYPQGEVVGFQGVS